MLSQTKIRNRVLIRSTPLPSKMMRNRARIDRLIDSVDSLAPYEGSLVRVARDKVYRIVNGQPEYVSALSKADWKTVKEIDSLPAVNTLPDWMLYGDETPAMLGMGGTVNAPDNPIGMGGSEQINKIKNAASQITPENIAKGQELVKSGQGLVTATQKLFGKGQTDPSRLPKTKALKEAEQTLLLPQSGAEQPSESFKFDTKYIWIIGGIIVAILVIKFALRK